MPEAHKLRGWYDNHGSTATISSISGMRGQSGGGSNALKTFAETKIENLGSGEKPDYYSVKAMVAMINKERALYMACPSQDCNKKVTNFEIFDLKPGYSIRTLRDNDFQLGIIRDITLGNRSKQRPLPVREMSA